jgi:hypothetical protein
MLLTPQHRRSSRLSRKATKPKIAKKETYDLSLQCDEEFASDWDANKEKRVLSEEDIYADCPVIEGFEYDKDYYLASSNYSTFIDNEIAKLTLAAQAKSVD